MAHNLTRRESILLGHIRAGKTISDAAREAGFSKKWPGQAGSQAFKNIQKKMPKILDELLSVAKIKRCSQYLWTLGLWCAVEV
jgi:hypothetical protein